MEKRVDTDALRVISGGVMGDRIGDGGRREAEAHNRRIGGLIGEARKGDKDAEIEIARLVYAPELTR